MTTPSNAADVAASGGGRRADPSLLKIRDLIYNVAGIYQPEDKMSSIEETVSGRMGARNIKTLEEYFHSLAAKPERDTELREILNELAAGETRFFRSPPQMDALRNSILPELTRAKSPAAQRKLRVWCAGCSTGEEAYTLAMVLMDEFALKYPGWTFELAATDRNENSLAAAKEGIYGEHALLATPLHFREKYFQPAGNQLQVKPEVKARISFSCLDLADETKIPFMKEMNIIACCNALIEFDALSKRRVVRHFFSSLLPGGYFFLGPTESLYGVPNEFHLVHFPQATAYFRPAPSPLLPAAKA